MTKRSLKIEGQKNVVKENVFCEYRRLQRLSNLRILFDFNRFGICGMLNKHYEKNRHIHVEGDQRVQEGRRTSPRE